MSDPTQKNAESSTQGEDDVMTAKTDEPTPNSAKAPENTSKNESKVPTEVLSETEAEEAQKQSAAEHRNNEEGAGFSLEVLGENVGEAMGQLRDGVTYWLARGRYNKVRIKRNGKAVLPDLPVGVLVALEAATFFWAGLLRAAVVNVAGRAFFEVELINEAEEHYRLGLEHYLAGELEDAKLQLAKSLEVDSRFAKAHLQLGILYKVQGKTRDAKRALLEAQKYDDGELEVEITAHFERIKKAHDIT
ncbi:MAG: hypothetical protein GY822_26130 [Deltaproteobacteria bacterium]|nr:hypothetical protein [Deltaproteobacteria bacterium]